jgi:hypothetical protein
MDAASKKKKKEARNVKRKAKPNEKPNITEYKFRQDCADDGNKIKHPANITGTRRKLRGK